MRLSLPIALAVPVVTLSCCTCSSPGAQPAKAQPSAAATAAPNAADAYRAAWSKLTSELNTAAGDVTLTPTGAQVAKGSPAGSWEEAAAVLREHQEVVADLMKAAAMPRCDFGLSLKSNNFAEVPGKLRASVRLLRADAARLWTDGQTDGALERIVAIYSMCGQVSHEPVVVVGLTDVALIMVANDTARAMAAGAAKQTLTAAQRQKLLDAINHLDRHDPAGLLRAVKAENAPLDQKTRAGIDRSQARLMDDIRKTREALGGH